jgi:hypothetical protein
MKPEAGVTARSDKEAANRGGLKGSFVVAILSALIHTACFLSPASHLGGAFFGALGLATLALLR